MWSRLLWAFRHAFPFQPSRCLALGRLLSIDSSTPISKQSTVREETRLLVTIGQTKSNPSSLPLLQSRRQELFHRSARRSKSKHRCPLHLIHGRGLHVRVLLGHH